MISWALVLPQGWPEWRSAGLLVLGGLVGWVVSPMLWFAWGPMRWPAFLLASAAQESGYDAEAIGAAGEVGILQFSASSPWTAAAAPAPSGGDDDWRLSPFWSGFYAARYYHLQAWSAPGLVLVWFVPILGAAVMRWTWTHALEDGGISAAVQEAIPAVYDGSTETSGERAFRVAYPLWWLAWHLPIAALVLSVYFGPEDRK